MQSVDLCTDGTRNEYHKYMLLFECHFNHFEYFYFLYYRCNSSDDPDSVVTWVYEEFYYPTFLFLVNAASVWGNLFAIFRRNDGEKQSERRESNTEKRADIRHRVMIICCCLCFVAPVFVSGVVFAWIWHTEWSHPRSCCCESPPARSGKLVVVKMK